MDRIQSYPGLPSMVPAVRRFVRAMLAECPQVDAAEIVASELATNAIRYSPAGQDGEFDLRITAEPGCWVRLAISDPGDGVWTRDEQPESADVAEFGRGLAIVACLADKVGHDVTESGQTMWAELAWEAQ